MDQMFGPSRVGRETADCMANFFTHQNFRGDFSLGNTFFFGKGQLGEITFPGDLARANLSARELRTSYTKNYLYFSSVYKKVLLKI